jgi:hypothetical protein
VSHGLQPVPLSVAAVVVLGAAAAIAFSGQLRLTPGVWSAMTLDNLLQPGELLVEG